MGRHLRFMHNSATAFLSAFTHRALQVELLRRGFRVELEKRITVRYKDVIVGEYDADLLVEDVVIVEIKTDTQN